MNSLFNILLILIVPLCSIMKEQNKNDSTILSVTYDAYYKKFEEEPKIEKDLMRLDIGEHSSQYVSVRLEYVSKHKNDIIAKKIKIPYEGYTTLRDEVYKNTPKSGYIQFVHMPGWVSCRDKIDRLFEWKLLEGDSVVCEYPCHKAVTTFRGRTWTVWYRER